MRNEKKWLDSACLLAITFTILDYLTTLFCLHYFSDTTNEANPLAACVFTAYGLYLGMAYMTLFWVGWAVLLRYTTLPSWVVLTGFSSIILCRLAAVINNSVVIFLVLQ